MQRSFAQKDYVVPSASRRRDPTKIRLGDTQFNEIVYGDLFKVHDQDGVGHWYLLLIDDATDCTIIALVASHSSETLWDAYETHWLAWAGPPGRRVTDNERGLDGAKFTSALARSGTEFDPAAAYAPWQKGNVERLNGTFKAMGRIIMKSSDQPDRNKNSYIP